MNYFELFEIPIQLQIEQKFLPHKYFELSKKFHPDYFINQSSEIQESILEKSAALNKGFNIFKNPLETIKYLLQLKGLLVEEEKYELPPIFLLQVMDINEQIEIAANEDNNWQIALHNLENEIYNPVKEIIENYKDGISTEKELLQVKDYYFKKKYLQRIQQQLNRLL